MLALSSLTDTPRPAPLVERERELDALDAALAAAAAGSGRALMLDAPPGLGKSALLDTVERRTSDAGWTTRRAAHGPRERYFAYGIVRTLLETPLRRLAPEAQAALRGGRGSLGPSADGAHGGAALAARLLLDDERPDGEPGALGHSLLRLCAALASAHGQPLALLVDDGQWADAQSLVALSHLARRIGDLPVLLVVAARSRVGDWEPDPVGLLGVEPSAVLHPQPLGAEAAATLARRRAAAASDRDCRRLHRSSGGNPWLLNELARQLALVGDAVLDDPLGRAVALSPEGRVQLRRRLADLSPADRAVADALAILAAAGSHHAVAEVVGPGAGDLSVARARLAADGLAHPTAWRLSHPLLEAAVRAELGPIERERLHHEAARLLRAEGAPPEQVAEHLLACGPAGDAAASATLQVAAARAAERGDPETAARLVARALDERAPGDDRAEILARLGTAAFHAGRDDAPAALQQALAASSDQASRVEILQRLGALQAFAPTGEWLDGVLAAGAAIDGDDPELKTAAALAAADALLTHADRHAERAARVQAIDPLATTTPELRAAALAHRAWLAAERGAPDAGTCAGLARAALADGVLLERADRRAGFHLCVRALLVSDRVEEAAAAIAALHGRAEETGSVMLAAAAAWYGADLALCVGRLADAERGARRVLELAPAPGLAAAAATELLVGALTERGELDAADAVLAERPELWQGNEGWETGVRHARARLLLEAGDYEQAAVAAREAGARRLAQGRVNPAWTPWRATLAQALAHLGRLEEATAVADENVALAHAFGAPTALLIALLARTVCEQPGEQRAARAAAALELEGPAVLERAQLQLELGATLVRLGRRVEARDVLRPAFATADAAGAAPLAERARRELVASGLRPRKAAVEGVAALTPRQAQVCGLAAGGKSNREIAQALFLSVKTVETHLAAAYEKLGVSGRPALVEALADEAP